MINVSIVGSGNLATQLGLALIKSGHRIVEVYSKNNKNAIELATKLNCDTTESLDQLKKVDLVIIAVKDDVITEVSEKIKLPAVHTSGIKSLNDLRNLNYPKGVFYPLQTFSKNKNISFKNIPICIESESSDFLSLLENLAKSLSDKVYHLDKNKRAQLHVSAVIACNFSNMLYQFAYEHCQNNDIPFEILHSLIYETANKIKFDKPKNLQTGPAKRKDIITIKNHLDLLENNKELKEAYQLLTNSIISRT